LARGLNAEKLDLIISDLVKYNIHSVLDF
jgi:hypothetical protein